MKKARNYLKNLGGWAHKSGASKPAKIGPVKRIVKQRKPRSK
jgi:hypothetical protein